MALKLYEESSVQAIADSIRGKNGSSNLYTIGQMAQAITNLPTSSGAKLYPIYNVQSNLIPNVKISQSWGGNPGIEIEDTTYTATDYIPVIPGETLLWIKPYTNEYASGYDENKVGISDNGRGVQCIARQYRDCGTFSSLVVPNDIHYIRFSHENAKMTHPLFNFYRINTKTPSVGFELEPFNIDYSACKGCRIVGDWSGSPGTETMNSNTIGVIATDYIPVEEGETIYWFGGNYTTEFVCGYDSNKDPIAQQGLSSMCNTNTGIYTVPAGMSYIRFSNSIVAMFSGLSNFYRLKTIA